MMKFKGFLINSAIVLVGAILNVIIFLESYKRLAFPFISEEQKVNNASHIFIYVFPCFVLASILLFFLYKAVMNTVQTKSP